MKSAMPIIITMLFAGSAIADIPVAEVKFYSDHVKELYVNRLKDMFAFYLVDESGHQIPARFYKDQVMVPRSAKVPSECDVVWTRVPSAVGVEPGSRDSLKPMDYFGNDICLWYSFGRYSSAKGPFSFYLVSFDDIAKLKDDDWPRIASSGDIKVLQQHVRRTLNHCIPATLAAELGDKHGYVSQVRIELIKSAADIACKQWRVKSEDQFANPQNLVATNDLFVIYEDELLSMSKDHKYYAHYLNEYVQMYLDFIRIACLVDPNVIGDWSVHSIPEDRIKPSAKHILVGQKLENIIEHVASDDYMAIIATTGVEFGSDATGAPVKVSDVIGRNLNESLSLHVLTRIVSKVYSRSKRRIVHPSTNIERYQSILKVSDIDM